MTLDRRRIVAWLALTLLVVAALPLHVCLPLWTDAHLFDVGARVLLHDGGLYREVFYHAPPGMVFAQAAVRGLFGWRGEVLRAVDFFLVAGSVLLLVGVILPRPRKAGASAVAACLLLYFYVGTPESCHCQPDFWMLLPALTALVLRVRQAVVLTGPDAEASTVGAAALAEGVCWGVGVLFKPSVMLPAAACWLLTAALCRRVRRLAIDLLGLLVGGLLVGGITVGWLVESGNWSCFTDAVFSDWLAEYHRTAPGLNVRALSAVLLPWPWGLAHLAAVPIALFRIALALHRPRATATNSRDAAALALLGTFYLTWFLQANFLQRQMTYHQAPAVVLALAVLVGHTWRSRWGTGWSVALIALAVAASLDHPLLHPSRLALWGRCWAEGGSPPLRDALTLGPRNPAIPTHVDLEAVADYLRRQQVADRELTCFTGSTLPLYTELALAPSTRHVQLSTFLAVFPSHRAQILHDLDAGPQRYVVWDTRTLVSPGDDERGEVRVAAGLADEIRFFREPVVFRAGRYVVHRVRPPAEREQETAALEPVVIPASVSP